MDPILRFASQADAMQLAELRWLSRGVKEQQLEHIDAFALRFSTWFASALTSKSWHVAVSEEQGSMLSGCMFLREVETVPVPGHKARAWGYVTHAFVREPSRNQGIGARLLDLLVGRARELRLHELQVWPSNRAVALYARAGFQSPEVQRAGPQPDEPSHFLPLRTE
jgi:GNAT superfamily N-acetyltransferase